MFPNQAFYDLEVGRKSRFLIPKREVSHNSWYFSMDMKVYLYSRISSKYYKVFPFAGMIENLNSHISMKRMFLCIRGFFLKYAYH